MSSQLPPFMDPEKQLAKAARDVETRKTTNREEVALFGGMVLGSIASSCAPWWSVAIVGVILCIASYGKDA
jgi:hypothetical protein